LLLIGFSVALVCSAVLFALIWLPRKLISGTEFANLSQRAWPTFASLALLIGFGSLQAGQVSAPTLLGNLTVYSLGFSAFTWLFAAATLISAYHLISSFSTRHAGNAFAWWHACAVSIACFVLLAYLGYYGLIGLQTWSY
jgi:hypothetical protein